MKKKTNKQLIKALTTDTIEEAFLVCAMERYCQTVLEGGETSNLINATLWQTIAKQNLETIKEHYA